MNTKILGTVLAYQVSQRIRKNHYDQVKFIPEIKS